MRRILFCIGFLLIPTFSGATFATQSPLTNVKAECLPPRANESQLSLVDLPWGIPLSETRERGDQIYQSQKRLKNRAYYDWSRKKYLLKWSQFRQDEAAVLPLRLIKSVRSHIETALQLKYVDAVYFSDFGHSHYFFPPGVFEKEIAPIFDRGERAKAVQTMLGHKDLHLLYHTAEQIRLKDRGQTPGPSEKHRWRYYTRNLLGKNNPVSGLEILHNLSGTYNTVRSYKNFKYYGAGFQISTSEKGCFPYQHLGETRYFDISLEDII